LDRDLFGGGLDPDAQITEAEEVLEECSELE
jgi:hypothetical protein